MTAESPGRALPAPRTNDRPRWGWTDRVVLLLLAALVTARLAFLFGSDMGYEQGYRHAIQDIYAQGWVRETPGETPEPAILRF